MTDRHLFEQLTLGGAQAGLSWATRILHKREGYGSAFAGFDPASNQRVSIDGGFERLLQRPQAIVRNRLKVESAVSNARRVLDVQEERGQLRRLRLAVRRRRADVGGWERLGDLPAETAESTAMSKDMKRKRVSLRGPTVCYAFMQAAGSSTTTSRPAFATASFRPAAGSAWAGRCRGAAATAGNAPPCRRLGPQPARGSSSPLLAGPGAGEAGPSNGPAPPPPHPKRFLSSSSASTSALLRLLAAAQVVLFRHEPLEIRAAMLFVVHALDLTRQPQRQSFHPLRPSRALACRTRVRSSRRFRARRNTSLAGSARTLSKASPPHTPAARLLILAGAGTGGQPWVLASAGAGQDEQTGRRGVWRRRFAQGLSAARPGWCFAGLGSGERIEHAFHRLGRGSNKGCGGLEVEVVASDQAHERRRALLPGCRAARGGRARPAQPRAGGAAPMSRRSTCDAVEVELDRCWDLLRQRGALRDEASSIPEQAKVPDADTVERYLQ